MPVGGRTRERSYAKRARMAWDRAIDVWEDFQERGKDFSRDQVHGPALRRAIGPLRGRSALDLGCGQGRFTRVLARAGARVVGVDWSREMIRAAQVHERSRPLGIEYHCWDARGLERELRGRRFDVVVGCMSFMDMPEVHRVLRNARRLLKPNGRLVFSVSHPGSTAALRWERSGIRDRGAMLVGPYFNKHVGLTEWRMRRLLRPFDTVYWHRTLEQWFRLLRRAGFVVEGVSELHPTPAQVRRNPLLEGSRRFPFYLVVSCGVRPGRTP